MVAMTPVRTRNVSQSVACRVVGMTWVINAAWYPLLICRLALRGNIILGLVTNCKEISSVIKWSKKSYMHSFSYYLGFYNFKIFWNFLNFLKFYRRRTYY
jgi:hypothetical protein